MVNAAGPWAKPLAASAGLDLPLRAVREQDTVWQVPAGRAVPKTSVSMGVDACYYRPLGQDRFIIGRGFPKEYFDVDPYNYKTSADADFISDVQTRVERRFPAFAGMRLIEAYAALYDVTPDWYPFVGPRAGLAGYADFSGGSGHGFKIAPAIGRELGRLAADRQGRRRLPPVQPRPHRGGADCSCNPSAETRRLMTACWTMALLEVKGLRQRFGGVTALDGADLVVEPGRITGLIGPNGAGKTTLFNAVTGALRPNAGAVTFDGTDVTGWRPDRLAAVGLSRTFQIARGLAQLTVIENLMLYGKHQPGETFCAAVLRTAAARAREEELRVRAIEVARELNLLHVGDNRAIDLSGGQKKLLELGRALMAEPKLIMLDEPAAGINPTLAKKLGEHILALKARGITFLIIEHNMGLVAALCDHVVVLVQGKRFTEGRFADLRADPRVQEAYMGHRA